MSFEELGELVAVFAGAFRGLISSHVAMLAHGHTAKKICSYKET
ncbi:hypothetical protein CCHOA_05665 [Corynebacterium choanae]|uniref:Uncharacterized protein n=1 Tax=Corynebacterium choanae TaxID=1862358 RepID=A0A3G6J6Z2_9CORY|nr:hypothetical protein CCHOA_05665 [Corynebacterium choanae]